jgi:hypothetical protein
MEFRSLEALKPFFLTHPYDLPCLPKGRQTLSLTAVF